MTATETGTCPLYSEYTDSLEHSENEFPITPDPLVLSGTGLSPVPVVPLLPILVASPTTSCGQDAGRATQSLHYPVPLPHGFNIASLLAPYGRKALSAPRPRLLKTHSAGALLNISITAFR